MTINRLSILGVGLLGGSLGLAAKKVVNGCKLIGYGHRPETLEKAMKLGAIDELATDPAAAVAGADFVILCTPVGIFEPLLRQIGPGLKPGAIVTDVGSTKRSVVKLATQLLPEGVHFVGSHPMAGSEKRGVEFARADLFQDAVCIVTPTPQTDPAAAETVEQFWRNLGMKVTQLSPEEHDQRVAMISHLPHAVAAALVAIQDEESFKLAGKGFLDATRIAAGDGGLWKDIFQDNADEMRDGLLKLSRELAHFAGMLHPERQAELKAWLDQIAERRGRL